MANSYDGNVEYAYVEGSGDFKRKVTVALSSNSEDENDINMVPEKVNTYMKHLQLEKNGIGHSFPNAERLLDEELSRVQQSGHIPNRDTKYVDIYREKPIRRSVKVLVPVREHPKFNFVGKLLGPKGNSMKRLQEETMCKMAVLGRGSMKDKKKEDEMRASLDSKYAHLNEDLHVEISALAPPAEAYARLAYALAEVRKYLVPDSNDIIRQEQIREMIAEGSVVENETEHLHRTGKLRPISRNTALYNYAPTRDRTRHAMEDSYSVYDDTTYDPVSHYDSYIYSNNSPVPRTSRFEVPNYEVQEYRREYYRDPSYVKQNTTSTSSRTSSWKNSSSSYGNSSHHPHHFDGHGTSLKHNDANNSYIRESRYRSSPYSRPTK